MGIIVSVDEIWSGDTASTTSGSDGSGSSKVTRAFQVVVSNANGVIKAQDVLADPRIPKTNSPLLIGSPFL